MTAFLIGYIGIALLVMLLVFGLSYRESPQNKCKTVLLIVYILAIFSVLFATGVLEARFQWNRLCSTLLAAGILGGIYLADRFGAKHKS